MEILELLKAANLGEFTVLTVITFILLGIVVELVRELIIKRKK